MATKEGESSRRLQSELKIQISQDIRTKAEDLDNNAMTVGLKINARTTKETRLFAKRVELESIVSQ